MQLYILCNNSKKTTKCCKNIQKNTKVPLFRRKKKFLFLFWSTSFSSNHSVYVNILCNLLKNNQTKSNQTTNQTKILIVNFIPNKSGKCYFNFDRRTALPMQPVPEDFHTEVRSYIAHTNSYGFVGVIYVIYYNL